MHQCRVDARGRQMRIGAVFASPEPGHIQSRQEDQRENGRDQQPSHDRKGHRSPEHRWSDRDHAENRRHCGEHAFLNDIAHDAVPTGKVADGDVEVSLANLDGSDTNGNYDNELLELWTSSAAVTCWPTSPQSSVRWILSSVKSIDEDTTTFHAGA
jgi:hypothetical protein